MKINITRDEIITSMDKIEPGLNKYIALMSYKEKDANWFDNMEFRRKFNGFYRVRRSADSWQPRFYTIMKDAVNQPHSYSDVLNKLYKATNRVEASFASKLYATVNPDAPVIDAEVLRNLDLRLPSTQKPAATRISLIVDIYEEMRDCFNQYVSTESGDFMTKEFRNRFPEAHITPQKILDLVLWQNRSPKQETNQQ